MRVMSQAGQRGFTLLEVMVAVAILAGGLTAIVGGIGMSIRSVSLASGYERARTVANNQLALFLAGRPERDIEISGVDDGVQWNLQAEPDPDLEALLRVRINARFYAPGGERTVTLVTREATRALPDRLSTTEGVQQSGIQIQ